jgi:hypothetical protein
VAVYFLCSIGYGARFLKKCETGLEKFNELKVKLLKQFLKENYLLFSPRLKPWARVEALSQI